MYYVHKEQYTCIQTDKQTDTQTDRRNESDNLDGYPRIASVCLFVSLFVGLFVESRVNDAILWLSLSLSL